MAEGDHRPASAVVSAPTGNLATRRSKLVSRGLRELLSLQPTQPDIKLVLDFFSFVRVGDTANVGRLLQETPRLARSVDPLTEHHALHHVATNGTLKMALLLLDAGANPDIRTPVPMGGAWPAGWDMAFSDCTPLHFAAFWGNLDVARELLACGADIEARSADHLASAWPLMSTEPYHGQRWECLMCHGETPLHAAVSSCRKNIVGLLLERGANINAKDSQGRTPLAFALDQRYTDLVVLLLDRGANPNNTSAERARRPAR